MVFVTGRVIGRATVRIGADTSPFDRALKASVSIAAISFATAIPRAIEPLITGASAAVGLLANTFTSAGIAVGAFGAAVAPQFLDIAEANETYVKSQKDSQKATAATSIAQELARKHGFKYGEQVKITADTTGKAKAAAQEYNSALSSARSSTATAAKGQELLKVQMAAMPPATRKFAGAFQGAKTAFKEWSDSLTPVTMPVLTRGLGILRSLMYKLTPFVKIAAYQLQQFMDGMGEGVTGRIFDKFGTNMQRLAGSSLKTVLEVVRNLLAGIAGIMNAFAPMVPEFNRGFRSMTLDFAKWSEGLGKSEGFHKYIDYTRKYLPPALELFKQLGLALLHILEAMGPISGVSLMVVTVFAELIASMPTWALKLLINALVIGGVALRLWQIGTAIAAAYTWLFTTAVVTNSGAHHANRIALLTSVIAMGYFRTALLLTSLAIKVQTAWIWLQIQASTAWAAVTRLVGRVALWTRIQLLLLTIQTKAHAAATRVAAFATALWTTVTTAAGRAALFAKVQLIALTVATRVQAAAARVAALATAVWTAVTTASGRAALFAKVQTIAMAVVSKAHAAALAVVTAAQWLWNAAITANPIGIIIVAIAALVAAIVFVAVKTDWFQRLWGVVWGAIKGTALAVGRWFAGPFVNFWKEAWNTVWGIIQGVWNWIKKYWPLLLGILLGPVGIATVLIIKYWRQIGGGIKKVWDGIYRDVISPVKTFFTKTIPGWAGLLRDGVVKAAQQMAKGFNRAWVLVKNGFMVPVKFAIETVYNKGIVGLWNTVVGALGMGKLKLDKMALPRGFATGGYTGPGARNQPAGVVHAGEYVTRAQSRERMERLHPGVLDFINRAGTLPGYEEGGIVGWFTDKAKKFGSLVATGLDFISDPGGMWTKAAQGIRDKITAGLGSSKWAQAIAELPRNILVKLKDKIVSVAKGLFGDWGGKGTGAAPALAWAKTQAGKPYLWGGVGPNGYDCSGWLGAVQGVLIGQNPHVRRWATGSFSGGNTAAGWVRGLPSAFRIGITHAGVGHTAGTLMGVNVESSGGVGVRVGGGARGYNNALFPAWYGYKPAMARAQHYVRGGTAPAGSFGLVGENGPELAQFLGRTRIYPAGRGPAAAGGAPLVVIERLVLENTGVIGSRHETERWLVESLDQLRRSGRLASIVAQALKKSGVL